jgi:hypothetical protein
MKLTKLSDGDGPGACSGKHCPAVYRTDRGSLVVQGYRVADAVSIDIPDNETIVEIPSDLIKKLVKAGELS